MKNDDENGIHALDKEKLMAVLLWMPDMSPRDRLPAPSLTTSSTPASL